MLLLQAQKGAELGLEQVAVHFANQGYIEHDRRNAIDIRLGQRPFVASEPEFLRAYRQDEWRSGNSQMLPRNPE